MHSASTDTASARPSEDHSTQTAPAGTARRALWATVIGMALLVLVLVAAIVQAAHEESMLGWILAAIALGWLGLACYALVLARRTLVHNQEVLAEKKRLNGTDQEGTGSVRDQKLAHSFQIVKVQNTVLREELAKGELADREVVERSLDTIDFTAKNGMGLAHAKDREDAPGQEGRTPTR